MLLLLLFRALSQIFRCFPLFSLPRLLLLLLLSHYMLSLYAQHLSLSYHIVPRRVTKNNEDCMSPLSPSTGAMFAVTMATNEKLAFSVPEVVKAKEIPSISFGKRLVIPKSS
jgi:hypothetical protein